MHRVLIVDDNEDNLVLCQEILEEAGFETSLARSGREALERARSDAPDAVLLDIQMPSMDGFEVCRQLKASASTRDVPVLFVTGKYYDIDAVATGLSAGAVDYIYKPIDERDLVRRVRRAIVTMRALLPPDAGCAPSVEPVIEWLEGALEDAERQRAAVALVLLALHGGAQDPRAEALAEAVERAHDALKPHLRAGEGLFVTAESCLALVSPRTRILAARNHAQRLADRLEAELAPWQVASAVACFNGARAEERPDAADLLDGLIRQVRAALT